MAVSKAAALKVRMELEKETPGTFRYREVAAPGKALIGTLYVPKAAAETLGNPKAITLTVEAE